MSELDPSSGLLRYGSRFPILLYRLLPGRIFGDRFLQLTTVGYRC